MDPKRIKSESPKRLSISDLLKGKKGRKAEQEAAEQERQPRAPWFSYRMQPASARSLRRIRQADGERNARRYRRGQVANWREANRDGERRAVAAIRGLEAEMGLAPGGLREHLIDEGLLEATHTRPAATTHLEIRQGVDAKGHRYFDEVEVRDMREVPRAHTVFEIAQAASELDDGVKL